MVRTGLADSAGSERGAPGECIRGTLPEEEEEEVLAAAEEEELGFERVLIDGEAEECIKLGGLG